MVTWLPYFCPVHKSTEYREGVRNKACSQQPVFSSHSPPDSPFSTGSVHIGWVTVRTSDSLNRMFPTSLRHLNTWFPVGVVVLGGLGSVILLEDVCHWVMSRF